MEQDLSLAQRLAHYASGPVTPFHMPGHKRRPLHSPALPWALDITEIAGFDDLHDPAGILAESMERSAALWGSQRAWYLVNGSTGGILAALHAALPRGSRLLAARNCHKAFYHALELLDLDPVFLQPPMDSLSGVSGSLSPAEVEAALNIHPDIRVLFLTSPTYDGVLSDLPTLCSLCHSRGVAVLVDEAHGAHLGFPPFPPGAVAAGADLVVQSLHKTLPSLTQTAILHWQGSLLDPVRVSRSLGIFETSSPSYPLMASMDGCVRLLEAEGAPLFQAWKNRLDAFDRAILPLKHLRVLCHGRDRLEFHPAFWGFDPSKLLISTQGTALTGPELMERLRRDFQIELEMAAPSYATAMTGPGDSPQALERLADALLAIDGVLSSIPLRRSPPPPPLPERVLPAGRALELDSRPLPFDETVGEVCAEYLWAYPPGIPLITPGERVPPVFPLLCRSFALAGVPLRSTAGNPSGLLQVVRAAPAALPPQG